MKKKLFNDFEEFFEEIKNTYKQRSFANYAGIIKKDYPKWEGWKVISKFKEEKITPANIQSKKLDTLVKNFYYLKFIQSLD